jgi:hypothetical protein
VGCYLQRLKKVHSLIACMHIANVGTLRMSFGLQPRNNLAFFKISSPIVPKPLRPNDAIRFVLMAQNSDQSSNIVHHSRLSQAPLPASNTHPPHDHGSYLREE